MPKSADSKIFHSIREVADLLEENESTLRYWESEFREIISPRRNERRVRLYSEKDIEHVRLIKYLIRDCGLTYDGARKRLNYKNIENTAKQARVVQHLQQIKTELTALKEALDEAERITLQQTEADRRTNHSLPPPGKTERQ
jgi:DNA-binding transcriptional MerR regulator